MPVEDLQSLVDGFVRDGDLRMIMTTVLGMSSDDFDRRRVATTALKGFGRKGVEFVLDEISRAPDAVAVFLFGTLHYFHSSLVAEALATRLDQFTGFKRAQLRRFAKTAGIKRAQLRRPAKRWWQFWK